MAYGVTAAGFVPKTLDVIVEEKKASWRATFGESVNLSASSRNMQIIGIEAEREAELWELAEAVFNAFSPDSASGSALDNLAALTGTLRDAATKSTVTLVAIGTNGTVLSSGRVVSVAQALTRFATTASATIATLTARATATAYAVGDLRSNGGNVYVCITAGTSSGGGGPTTTAADITDNTVHWKYLGVGTAAVYVAAQAEQTGPNVANAGTLTVIETPVSGWNTVTNVHDADLGRAVETDAALRIKREDELRAAGDASTASIRSNVLQVSGVTACTVFENDTDVTDVDGLPPHSVEVMVQGGTDAGVAAEVFASKAAGIATYGTDSEVVVDDQGNNHTVYFSRPGAEDIWAIVTLVKDPLAYPLDGDTQVKDAIVAFGDAQATGKNVVASSLAAQAFEVPGVLDVTSVLIGTVNPPVASTTIAMDLRDLAVFDTSRITVVSSDGTP